MQVNVNRSRGCFRRQSEGGVDWSIVESDVNGRSIGFRVDEEEPPRWCRCLIFRIDGEEREPGIDRAGASFDQGGGWMLLRAGGVAEHGNIGSDGTGRCFE